MALEEDIEKLMKEQKQNQTDQKKQIDQLTEKNNTMQTKFENAKQQTYLAQEKAREQASLKAEAEQKIAVMQKTV